MSTFDINVSVFIFYLEHQDKLPPRVQRIVICKILIRRFFVALYTVGVREKTLNFTKNLRMFDRVCATFF